MTAERSSTVNAELLTLAERVEKLTGPDREIERAIADIVFDMEWKPYRLNARKLWGYVRGTDNVKFYRESEIPNFTASLDAAMTLVPKTFAAEIRCYPSGHGMATLWDGGRRFNYDGNTPALALTVASLRASAALSQVQP